MVLITDNADLVCPLEAWRPRACPRWPRSSPSKSSKTVEAKYETPSRFRPPMRVQIKNTNGEYQFNVRLDRGMSPQVLLPNGPTDAYLFPADASVPAPLCRRSRLQEQAPAD